MVNGRWLVVYGGPPLCATNRGVAILMTWQRVWEMATALRASLWRLSRSGRGTGTLAGTFVPVPRWSPR